MNKYIYAECPVDYWPGLRSVVATSLNNAVEKLIERYATQFDDDKILEFDNFKQLREYLNEFHELALSDLEIYEEL